MAKKHKASKPGATSPVGKTSPSTERRQRRVHWTDIRSEFQEILDEVSRERLPTQNEIDAFKASLIVPKLVKSPLRRQFNYGLLLTPGDDRRTVVDYVREVFETHEATEDWPEHLTIHKPTYVEVIKSATKRRRSSLKFLQAWGELKQAYGCYLALIETDETANKQFIKNKKAGLKKDTILQKYWYAHWMKRRRYPGDLKDPTFEQDKLAALCNDITAGVREPVLYDAAWFKRMIRDITGDPGNKILKDTYTSDTSHAELKRMVANELIPRSALPPLTEEKFPLRTVRHP